MNDLTSVMWCLNIFYDHLPECCRQLVKTNMLSYADEYGSPDFFPYLQLELTSQTQALWKTAPFEFTEVNTASTRSILPDIGGISFDPLSWERSAREVASINLVVMTPSIHESQNEVRLLFQPLDDTGRTLDALESTPVVVLEHGTFDAEVPCSKTLDLDFGTGLCK